MKLSDVKGERVFDVIADILPLIYKISADPQVQKLLEKQERNGQTSLQSGMEWMAKAVGPLCRKHKNDFVDILASIEGVTREEYYESLDFAKLIMDVGDLFSDPLIRTVFFSKTPSKRDSSGSASENTEARETQ